MFCSLLFPLHYLQEISLFLMFRVCNIFGNKIKLDCMHNIINKEGHDFLLSLIDCVLPYVTIETQSFKINNFQSYQSHMNIESAKDLL